MRATDDRDHRAREGHPCAALDLCHTRATPTLLAQSCTRSKTGTCPKWDRDEARALSTSTASKLFCRFSLMHGPASSPSPHQSCLNALLRPPTPLRVTLWSAASPHVEEPKGARLPCPQPSAFGHHHHCRCQRRNQPE
jgi:hypothetical protein